MAGHCTQRLKALQELPGCSCSVCTEHAGCAAIFLQANLTRASSPQCLTMPNTPRLAAAAAGLSSTAADAEAAEAPSFLSLLSLAAPLLLLLGFVALPASCLLPLLLLGTERVPRCCAVLLLSAAAPAARLLRGVAQAETGPATAWQWQYIDVATKGEP